MPGDKDKHCMALLTCDAKAVKLTGTGAERWLPGVAGGGNRESVFPGSEVSALQYEHPEM